MRVVTVPLAEIYIPAAKRKTLEEDKIEPLAEDILENGLLKPVYVREGKGRYVLQEGLHRIEALKLLGETKVKANIIQARKA